MATTEAQKRAIRNYREKNKDKYTEVRFRVSIEEKEALQKLASDHNESLSSFLYNLIKSSTNI